MSRRSTLLNRRKGLCLLSLDAGGPRGISQLEILAELMHRWNFEAKANDPDRPCSVFDMIGGTGSGGFIAILLVVFGLTAADALGEFVKLTVDVLELGGIDAEARTMMLKRYIDKLMERHVMSYDKRLLDPNDRSKGCKLIVPISYKHHVGPTVILRNFGAHERALNLTITEAMLVTLATPPLFTPASISKDAATFEYIGGDLILSNPLREIIVEAHGTFGAEGRIACLLSLGPGHRGSLAIPSDSSATTWNTFLEHLVKDSEQQARSIDSQMGHLGIYYRFRVVEGLETTAQMVDPNPSVILSHTAVYLEDATVSRKLDTFVNSLKARDGCTSLEQLKHSGGQTIIPSPLPPVTKNFVIRREQWEFIEKVILGTVDSADADRPTLLVVTGMGGCGKTQITLKFMEVHRDKFASRSFIDSSSETRIRADIVRHVRSFGPEHSQKTFEDCLRFLAQPLLNDRRLMLYDNVNDPDLELAPLLPHGGSCVVLITSRNRLIGELYPDAHLELGVMSMEEAVELLLGSAKVTYQEEKDARATAEALGHLPIALQQARSYMSKAKCSFGAYLERLHSSRDKLLAQVTKHQLDMHSISTYAAFDTSFDKLTPHAQMLLRILSFFHWRNFPLELIMLAAKHNFVDYEHTYIEQGSNYHTGDNILDEIFLLGGKWDITHLDEMMISLQNYSLVTLVSGVDTMLLQMHPLTHGWVQSCIPEEERDRYQSGAILLLALGARNEYTPSAQYLISHVTHFSPFWNQLHINDAAAFGVILRNGGLFDGALQLQKKVVAEVRGQFAPDSITLSNSLWTLALTYSDMGRFSDAEGLQEEVLRLRKATLGEHDLDTIMASNNLASTYADLGRFKDAERLQEEVLRLRTEILGECDPDTIMASNNLASTYGDLGRFKDAERLQEEVLRLRREILGERHPDTIMTSNNLAITYRDLGRFDEAERLQEEVLRLRKEILGGRHPDTIMTSNNLAITYRDLRRFNQAEQLQEEVLRLRKEILGERHPDTVSASNNLALTYSDQGRFREAERVQEEVLRLRKETLGERHPDTIMASHNLASTYHDLGRFDEAKELQEEVSRLTKEILGERHPDTIMASNNLAFTYWSLGRFVEAERLQGEVLRVRNEILGERHPDSIAASSNLAFTYWSLGRFDEAESLQQEVLRLRKEILGERHPDTIMASNNLAITYRDLGRYQDAERLREEVLSLRKEILGKHHTDTITASNNLAISYCDVGRFTEAESLQKEVLRLWKETLGERHPDTIMASNNLASTYHDLGRFDEAEHLQVEIVKLRKEVLGEHHPDTAVASSNLAITYRDLGRFDDAERLQEEVLRTRQKILGARHPETLSALNNLALIYHDLGRFDEAKRLQEEVLAMTKEVLGDQHPDILAASSSLANTYTALGKLDQAKVLEEEVLRLSKKILGERHPRTLAASNNLAWTYRDLGRLNEAEMLQLEALSLSRELLGDRHPDSTNAMLTLAAIYGSLHKNSDALGLLAEAAAIIAETLGTDHPQYREYQETKARVEDTSDAYELMETPQPYATPAAVDAPPSSTRPEAQRRHSRRRKFLDLLRNRFHWYPR